MPSSIEIVIRDAGTADVGTILRFIRDLASYERLDHAVVADEDRLRATLFGERRFAECRIAERGGAPVGFALFFHNYSTFLAAPGLYLEDLYVMPEHRGAGVGHRLLRDLARIAVDRGCRRVDWSVLEWNEPALRLYRSIGAVSLDDWKTQRLAGEALDTLASTSP